MELAEYHYIHEKQGNHWWYRSLHQFVGDCLADKSRDSFRCLDIGAGPGGLIHSLRVRFPRSRFAAVDPSPTALQMLRERAIDCCRGDFSNYGKFEAERWDVIVATDSICYLKTTARIREALDRAHAHLRPGGVLVIQTAAHPTLAGRHDRQVHCERRFTLRDTGEWLAPEAWNILRLQYRHCIFSPLIWLWRAIQRRGTLRPASDLRSLPRWLDFLLHGIARAEDKWMPLPLRGLYGSSLFLFLQRKERHGAGNDIE